MMLWIGMVIMTLCAVSLLWMPLRARPKQTAVTEQRTISSVWLVLVSLLFIAIPLGIYEQTRWPAWKAWQQKLMAQAIDVRQFGDVQTVINRMQTILVQNPQSAQGWFLLGRLYESQKQVENALAALEKAYTLETTKMDYLMAYAEVFSVAHQGVLDADLRTALARAQRLPDAPLVLVLHLLALDAYVRQDYKTAIQNWEQSIALTPAQSPERETILRWLGKAQMQR